MKALLSLLVAAAFSTAAVAEVAPPKLIVAISVDQFSADLFNEYRAQFTGGLKRLQQGAVFPAGYHAHAATETCPGHATLLTGDFPSRTGIIANNWMDLNAARDDKRIYCSEDETVPGSNSKNYTVSFTHLRVPTLGDRMKAANPQSRIFSVAGKDRAAIMMGGHTMDAAWWWDGKSYVSFKGHTPPAPVASVNARVTAMIAKGLPAPQLPALCAARVRPIEVAPGRSVGNAPAPLAAGDADKFNIRPEFDQATLDIASGFIASEKLGHGPATDLIAIGVSATDYVGHGFGTEGPEMCVQLMALDRALGQFFAMLDKSKIEYAVMLSADHGGHDIPERNRERAIGDDQRIAPELSLAALNKAVGYESDPVLLGDISGDIYVAARIAEPVKSKVIADAVTWLTAQPQVAAALTADELGATTPSTLPPEAWTLRERAAASFDARRSGDLVVLLKPRVVPIANPAKGSVATHGSPWDYDRRVPILFWWPGMVGFEQPNSIETVDIMPSLAGLIGLPVNAQEIDGHCRDLDAGPGTTCP